MSEENKNILQKILRGELTPEDSLWSHVWKDDSYKEVRSLLHEVDQLKPSDLQMDDARIWAAIEHECNRRRQSRYISFLKYVAVICLPIVLSIVLWQMTIQRDIRNLSVLENTRNQAVLLLGNGETINLSSCENDTVIQRDNFSISMDSTQQLKYHVLSGGQEKMKYNTLLIPRGGEFQLVLSDGTKVFLNSESKLRYPVSFAGPVRRIYLEGEGYFNVKRDTLHPFIVQAGEMEVEVLGTSFNMNAYESGKYIRTTLVEGKVKIIDRKTQEKRILKPGQRGEWHYDTNLNIKDVNIYHDISWMQGKFYFSDASLEQISRQLERWYDVEFFFVSEHAKNLLFTGVINKDYAIEEMLGIIAKTTNVKFTLKNRTVIVSK